MTSLLEIRTFPQFYPHSGSHMGLKGTKKDPINSMPLEFKSGNRDV